MNSAATLPSWPQIPTEPVDTYSDQWRRECLARHLARSDDNTVASWREANARTPALIADIEARITLELQLCFDARQLLRTRPHSDIRAWLSSLSHPHRPVWAERLTREKQAIKEATYGEH